MPCREIKFRYEKEELPEGSITSNLDFDVMVLHQSCSFKVLNAFFRHGGKCLVVVEKNGIEYFFRRKWLYVPFYA